MASSHWSRLGRGYAWASIRWGWNDFTLDYIQPLGDIFINILKLIAVPLVLFSIIGGVASLGDVKKLGRLGGKTLGLYLLTTFFSVTLGLVLVNVFEPGSGASDDLKASNRIRYELWRDANGIEVLDELQLTQDPANEALVAQTRGSHQISVDPPPGDHVLTLVDSVGARLVRPFTVLAPQAR